MQLDHAFFDRALGNEFVDEDRFVLADAVGAVGGLILDRRVPPGIVMDDRVGGRQIEAGAAGFEADQEDRYPAPLKAGDRAGTVDGPGLACRDESRPTGSAVSGKTRLLNFVEPRHRLTLVGAVS